MIKVGNLYRCQMINPHDFHGIVRILDIGLGSESIECDVVKVFSNELHWRTNGIFVPSITLKEEITREKNPEYFL